MSRYSASDSWPVDSARPKCSFGRGENPSRVGDRQLGAPDGALPAPGQVAVAGPADLAELGEPEADPHTASAPAAPAPTPGSGSPGTSPPRRGPGRCPGSHQPAGPPRPRCARCRSRCRPRSRSRASSGSPRGRPRRARRASPATGSPCAGRPTGDPTAGPRPRCGGGRRTSRSRARCAAMASTQSSEVEVLATTPGRCRRGATPPRSPPEPAVTPAHDALGHRGLRVVPLELTPCSRRVASRSRLILRCSSSLVFCPNHWNGVNGLGTKPPTDTVTDGTCGARRPISTTLRASVGDAQRVLVGLGGEAGEEVQLHPTPALRVRRLDGAVEVFFADQLVDDLAHAPGAGLGSEREAGAASLLDLRRRRPR
jgi:hypothetical protein